MCAFIIIIFFVCKSIFYYKSSSREENVANQGKFAQEWFLLFSILFVVTQSKIIDLELSPNTLILALSRRSQNIRAIFDHLEL